jgi:type II secretory pathway component PulC
LFLWFFIKFFEKNTTVQQVVARWTKSLNEWKDVESVELLSKAKIIGMTTTGAAKNSGLLQKLGAEAMIIEEAGQVLESHVLTAMTPNLKRLILLGKLLLTR